MTPTTEEVLKLAMDALYGAVPALAHASESNSMYQKDYEKCGKALEKINELLAAQPEQPAVEVMRAGEWRDADPEVAIKSRPELSQALISELVDTKPQSAERLALSAAQPSSGAVDERLNTLIQSLCNAHFECGSFDHDFGDRVAYGEYCAAADRAEQELRDYLSAPTAAPALTDERKQSPIAGLSWSEIDGIADSCTNDADGLDVRLFAKRIAALTSPQASQLEQRIAELEAARRAYASEFPPDAEGEPDVGTIHANIRKLKAQASQSSQQEREDAARLDLFENNPEYELSSDWDDHKPWVVHRVIGSPNDREWKEVGRGATVRAAIDAAIAARAQEKAE